MAILIFFGKFNRSTVFLKPLFSRNIVNFKLKVGIPYIKTKLDDLYENVSENARVRLLGGTFSRVHNERQVRII